MIDPKVGDTVVIETKKTNWNGESLESREVTKVGPKYFYVATDSKTWQPNIRFPRKCVEGSICLDEDRRVVWSSAEAKVASDALHALRSKMRALFRNYCTEGISPKATAEDLRAAYRLLTGADR